MTFCCPLRSDLSQEKDKWELVHVSIPPSSYHPPLECDLHFCSNCGSLKPSLAFDAVHNGEISFALPGNVNDLVVCVVGRQDSITRRLGSLSVVGYLKFAHLSEEQHQALQHAMSS